MYGAEARVYDLGDRALGSRVFFYFELLFRLFRASSKRGFKI